MNSNYQQIINKIGKTGNSPECYPLSSEGSEAEAEAEALPLQQSIYAGAAASSLAAINDYQSPENLTIAEKIAACSKRIAARNNEYSQQQQAANVTLSSYGPDQSFDTISSPLTRSLLDNPSPTGLDTLAMMNNIDVPNPQQHPIRISETAHAQLLAEYKLHDTIASVLAHERESQHQLAHFWSSHDGGSQQHQYLHPQIAPSHQQRSQLAFFLYHHQRGAKTPEAPSFQMNESAFNAFPPLNLRGRPGAFETFPMTLHRALAELELTAGGKNIAGFLADGKAFQVRDQYLLEKKMLPIFFPKMRSFASFQRQLNLYDFQRI
jgi:hypothetical protein